MSNIKNQIQLDYLGYDDELHTPEHEEFMNNQFDLYDLENTTEETEA